MSADEPYVLRSGDAWGAPEAEPLPYDLQPIPYNPASRASQFLARRRRARRDPQWAAHDEATKRLLIGLDMKESRR